MKTLGRAGATAWILGLVACSQGSGDMAKASTPTAQLVPAVTLQAQPDLRDAVGALPRIVGDSPAIQAINADLAKLDQAARDGGCDSGEGFERGVTEPMTGPGYVTFAIDDGYYCEGSAHPSFEQTTITYDLQTGQRVDWVKTAPGLALTRGDTSNMPATYVPGLSSTALTTWYSRKMLAATDDPDHLEECRDVYDPESLEGTDFKIWLDAENGGLSVGPNLSHVIQACADPATMTDVDMRRFGVSSTIIDAVAAAHAAGNWAPKDVAEADAN